MRNEKCRVGFNPPIPKNVSLKWVSTIMFELPRNVREFVVRDIIYIIGGGSVIVSFLYCFDRLPNEGTPVAFYFLGAGIAYVVGCAIQDLFSIIRLVTTGPVERPGGFIRRVYRRFTGEEWLELKDFDPGQVRQALRSVLKNDEVRAARYERAISGMILATTMAPCTFLSGSLILLRTICSPSAFDFAVAAAALLLSLGLFVLAWLKAVQITRIDGEVLADYRDLAKETDIDSDA
ncbi:MAG: RING finger protein [Planctomycetota bacterium]